MARAYQPPPILLTENGAATQDVVTGDRVHDAERIRYLAAHLAALAEALRRGVDVRGYFAWTLLDNFEWAHGLSRRFGLVHVDHATQRRLPKDSARWLQALLRSRRAGARAALRHG
ncbi:MAG: family 1 glycosylhydrolase [Anaeromyxobacter sp.]